MSIKLGKRPKVRKIERGRRVVLFIADTRSTLKPTDPENGTEKITVLDQMANTCRSG